MRNSYRNGSLTGTFWHGQDYNKMSGPSTATYQQTSLSCFQGSNQAQQLVETFRHKLHNTFPAMLAFQQTCIISMSILGADMFTAKLSHDDVGTLGKHYACMSTLHSQNSQRGMYQDWGGAKSSA